MRDENQSNGRFGSRETAPNVYCDRMGARATLSERTKRIHIQYKHLKSIAELGVDLVASILHERRVHGDSVVIWSMINSARPFVRFVGGNGVPWLRDQTL